MSSAAILSAPASGISFTRPDAPSFTSASPVDAATALLADLYSATPRGRAPIAAPRDALPTPPASHCPSPAPSVRATEEELPTLFSGSVDAQLRAQLEDISEDGDNEDAFFVADLSEVYRQHRRWVKELPRIEPFYAVKCNPDPYVIRLLAALGCGFDCASQSEIASVLAIPSAPSADRIIFANPCKPASFVRHARRNGVEMMTFDNADEVTKIARLFPSAKLVIRILTDDSKSICRFGIKFGAPLDTVPALLALAREKGLDVIGVSFHVGSGCYDPQSYEDAIDRARRAFDMGRQAGYEFSLLDVGGGFGHDNFELLARGLAPAVEKHFPASEGVRVIAEPGRFFVHNAYTLATNIVARRGCHTAVGEEHEHVDLEEMEDVVPQGIAEEAEQAEETAEEQPTVMFYTNDGVYGAFNSVMFDHAHPQAKVLSMATRGGLQLPAPANEGDVEACSIWGPTCDSIDCIQALTRLPRGLQVGDWLRWDEMGAYTICAASTFNGFKRSEVRYTSGVGADSLAVRGALAKYGDAFAALA